MGKVIKNYRYNGKWKEKEIEDSDFLYENEVEEMVGKPYMKYFYKWVEGQGCPLMSDGSVGFFSWDVQEFISNELTWYTLDGKAIKIPNIDDTHLLNIKKHLEKRIKEFNRDSSKEWLKKIEEEIKRRKNNN